MGIIMKYGVCYSNGSDSDSASLGTGWILYKTQTGSVAVDISEIYDKATEFYVVAKADGSNSNTLNSLITRNAIENGLERLSLGGDPNIALIEVSNTVFSLTYMKWTSVVTANSVLEIYYKTAEAVVAPVIYSDEEREVGVWRDGKPLYQITYTTAISSNVSGTQIDITALDVDTAVDMYGTLNGQTTVKPIPNVDDSSTSNNYALDIINNKTTLRLTKGSGYFIEGTLYITLRYTKTTDTPGSGTWTPSGVPAVHYSTDEQIIGTWVDGKTLYQKTFVRNDITTRSEFNLVDDSGIQIHDVKGQFIDPWGSYFDLVAYYDNENYRTYSFITHNLTQVRAYCSFGSTRLTNVGAVFTIQYTKTTS